MENSSAPLNDEFIDFYALGRKILYPVRLLTSNLLITSLFFIAAIVLSVTLRFTLTPRYAANFIVSHTEKKDLYFINMLLDLSKLAEDKDEKGLAQELQIDEADAATIKKIKLDPLRSSSASGDSLTAVMVTVHTTNPEKMAVFQDHILNYLENSAHYQKAKKLRIAALNDMRKKIDNDISEIDSVKNLVVSNIKPPTAANGGLVYNVPLDPFRAYEVNLEWQKRQITLTYQESNANSFEIVKNYVVNYKPVWPKLSLLLIILTPVSLLICILFLHRREKNRNASH